VPIGFNNTGVICWFNSLLQALISCTSLTSNIIASSTTDDDAAPKFMSLYAHIVRSNVNNADISGMSARLLSALVRYLHSNSLQSNSLLGNSQECAYEGFTQFLDAVGEPAESFHMEHEACIICPECNSTSVRRDKSYALLVNDLFETAEEVSASVHKFSNKLLDYKCENCGKVSNTVRTYTLKQLRNCIVLFYNQFYAKTMKWFPPVLSFPGLPRDTRMNYKLMAQIEHVGGMNGGHYYAYVNRSDDWYCVNDSSVSKINPGPTLNTFMVFYNIVK